MKYLRRHIGRRRSSEEQRGGNDVFRISETTKRDRCVRYASSQSHRADHLTVDDLDLVGNATWRNDVAADGGRILDREGLGQADQAALGCSIGPNAS
jgi:hypothetical protein